MPVGQNAHKQRLWDELCLRLATLDREYATLIINSWENHHGKKFWMSLI